jgi:hypothetical protein
MLPDFVPPVKSFWTLFYLVATVLYRKDYVIYLSVKSLYFAVFTAPVICDTGFRTGIVTGKGLVTLGAFDQWFQFRVGAV